MSNQYRKKPVVIEAIKFDGTLTSLEAFNIPEVSQDFGSRTAQIYTLEGVMTAEPGDWIIKGVKGEFYPCKPDIFAATYEDVAARELDVEAERREFEAWAIGPDGPWTARVVKNRIGSDYGNPEFQTQWECWRAARSAAQSTAPVSTEQAGDAP